MSHCVERMEELRMGAADGISGSCSSVGIVTFTEKNLVSTTA